MSFLKHISHLIAPLAKPIAKVVNEVPGGNIIAPIVGQAFGIPAPLTSAYLSYGNTGSFGKALKSAGLTYAGQQIGGALGSGYGNVGDHLGPLNSIGSDALDSIAKNFGNDAGQFAGNVVDKVANTNIGSALGGYAGNSIANSAPQPSLSGGISPFQPKQSAQSDVPASLSGLSTLTPDQQASNVATKGVYGGGNGPEEQSYFTNLVNRQLVDKSGKVNDISALNPIEHSYLSQLGLGHYSNSNDLLKALSTWQAS